MLPNIFYHDDFLITSLEIATRAHMGQYRKMSEIPYITHPKYVAKVVWKLTKDKVLSAAALLHDVFEDTDYGNQNLLIALSDVKNKKIDWVDTVDSIIALVTELTNDKIRNQTKKEYILAKMAFMSSNALTIKLADRFHNVLFLDKDRATDKDAAFIAYYVKNTSYILTRLETMRRERNAVSEEREFNRIQKALIKRIEGILEFLSIEYGISLG